MRRSQNRSRTRFHCDFGLLRLAAALPPRPRNRSPRNFADELTWSDRPCAMRLRVRQTHSTKSARRARSPAAPHRPGSISRNWASTALEPPLPGRVEQSALTAHARQPLRSDLKIARKCDFIAWLGRLRLATVLPPRPRSRSPQNSGRQSVWSCRPRPVRFCVRQTQSNIRPSGESRPRSLTEPAISRTTGHRPRAPVKSPGRY
ncbi:hypothetical protein C8T65DRAFT_173381 [Cerioporus squamosus]|nr:hypothetical protein C8T65DRAFT_173217 [Cerioporus squamosus]KAI0722045.1 hypothetical protein C8T65DRAFT_173381 [Cerioporus squamosus]